MLAVFRGAALGLAALAALPALAQAPAKDVPLGQLPPGVSPTAYRLSFTVDPSKARFSGHTEIDTDLAAPTRAITLHGLDLKVSRASVMVGGKRVAAKYRELDPSGVARLELAREVPAGKAVISIDYSAGFRSGAEGLFRAKVGADWYAWTQMEPIDARRMFPSFDQPSFKTPFTVTLTVPSAVKAFANTPETGITRKGGMTVHRFAPSKPLPTYLVAVGVGPFDVAGVTIPANAVRKTPLEFRVIATRGQAPRMAYTLAEGPKILGILEDYFGSPYPYEKLDLIASPVMGGAMENAGLVVFSDSLILLDADAPFSQLRGFGEVTAHELAHQWFGDLVTPVWWTDIWLNESFAEWMGKKASDRWRPDLGIAASELDDAFDAMGVDSLGKGRPIRQEITRNDQISSAFDAITYQKGAHVVSMFESFVGPETFRKGVQLHLSRYAFGNATAEQFFASIGEAAGDPRVVPALRSFTDQTGVPLVTVRETPAGISLSQTRHRPLGVVAGEAQLWKIPLCLKRGEGRTCTLLETQSATLPPLIGTELALMPNADGGGYLRFSPGDAGWEALLAKPASLSGRDAMAVADSLWADFGAGRTSFGLVSKGASALAGHPERLAAASIGNRISGLADVLLEPGQHEQYNRMMRAIYTPRLVALGFDPASGAHAGEPVPRQSLRQSLLPLVAFEAKDPAVRAQLAAAAKAWLGGKADALDPAYRASALAVAVQEGGAPFMEELSARLIASDDPLFRSQAAAALGRVADAAQADVALRLAFATGMQSLETARLVLSVAQQSAGRDPAVAFAEANFTRLVESFPGFARTSIIGMFGGYCTAADAARVEAMLRPKLPVIGGGELVLGQVVEQIRLCAALKEAKGAEISGELARY